MVEHNILPQSNKTISIPLCSRCMSHEITSWMNEKWKELDEEVRREIIEELKTIKLRIGECIVCKNNLVSVDTPEKILRIMEENNIPNKTRKEFEKFFLI